MVSIYSLVRVDLHLSNGIVMEIWKDVIGYEEYFQISNEGRLFSKRSEKVLKQTISKTGYYTVSTKIGGRSGINKCFKIHRLVAEAFLSNPECKRTVNHIDGCKLNNNLSNLEWATDSENTQHAHNTGLAKAQAGTKNTNSKLTEEQVNEIRIRRANGETCRYLGELFGVHHMQISRISRNVSYKN